MGSGCEPLHLLLERAVRSGSDHASGYIYIYVDSIAKPRLYHWTSRPCMYACINNEAHALAGGNAGMCRGAG